MAQLSIEALPAAAIHPIQPRSFKSTKAKQREGFSFDIQLMKIKTKNLLDKKRHPPHNYKCAKKQTHKRPSPHRLEA
jgi:hypothetical protein